MKLVKLVNGSPMGIPIGEHEKKRFWPIIVAGAAALGSAISAAATNSRNAQAQEDANAMNLQIARETNQANKDLYQQQFADQVKLFNMNNQYNSASQQMQRLSDAGLNPALNIGDGSAGTASMPSAPSPNPAVGAQMQAVKYSDVGSTIAGAVSQIASSFESLNKGESSRLGNQYIEAQNLSDLNLKVATANDLLEHAHLNRQQRSNLETALQGLKIQNQLAQDTYQDLVKRPALENQVYRSQSMALDAQEADLRQSVVLKKVQEAFQIDENSRRWTMINKDVEKMDAEISLLASQGKLNEASLQRVLSLTIGQDLENEQMRLIQPFVIDHYKSEIDKNFHHDYDFSLPFKLGSFKGGYHSSGNYPNPSYNKGSW